MSVHLSGLHGLSWKGSGLEDLYEVAAGVFEYGNSRRPCLCWLHVEHDTALFQPFKFLAGVFNLDFRQNAKQSLFITYD